MFFTWIYYFIQIKCLLNNIETEFMKACYLGDIELLKLLLTNEKLDPNIKNDYGYTGFMVACMLNNIKTIKLLLTNEKIDIDIKDKYENSLYKKYNIKNNITLRNIDYNMI